MRTRYLVLGAVAGLAALAGGALYYAFNSEWGLRKAYELAQQQVPGELEAQQVRGSLAGPIALQGVRLDLPNMTVTIQDLHLEWSPSHLLLDRTLKVDDIQVAGVDVQLKPVPPAEAPPADKEGGLPQLKLPIDIVLDGITIDGIAIQRAGEAPPIPLEQVHLAAALEDNHIRVDTFRLRSPMLDLAVTGELDPGDDYAATIDARWELTPPDLGRSQGRAHLEGDLDRLEAAVQVHGATEMQVDAVLSDIRGDLEWQGQIHVDTLNPRRIKPSWPDMVVSGRLKTEGTLEAAYLTAALRTTLPQTGPLNADLSLQAGREFIQIERLALDMPHRETHLLADGRVQLDEDFKPAKLRIDGSWEQLNWPLLGDPMIHSDQGSLHAEGMLDDYQAKLYGHLSGPNIPPGQWQIHGEGDLSRVRFSRLKADILDGELDAVGEVSWRDEFSWRAAVNASDIDPRGQWQDWPGRITATLLSEGRMAGDERHVMVNLKAAHGKLRGYPLEAEGKVTLDNDAVQVDGLRLRSGESVITAGGRLDERWQARFRIDAPHLAALWPDARGTLLAAGQLSGPRRQPALDASVQASDVRFNDITLAALDTDLVVDLTDQQRSRIILVAQKLAVGDFLLEDVAVDADGTMVEHVVEAKVSTPQQTLRVAVAGGYREQAWRGVFSQTTIETERMGRWFLQDPVAVLLSARRVRVAPACWRQDGSRLCTEVDWYTGSAKTSQVTLSAEALPLGLLSFLLPPRVATEGTVDMTLNARVTGQTVDDARFQLTLSPGALVLPVAGDQRERLDYQSGEVSLQIDEAGVDGQMKLLLGGRDAIHGAVSMPGFRRLAAPADDQPLQASLQGRVDQLELVPSFVPALADTSGQLILSLFVRGTAGDPAVNGEIALQNGSAVVVAQGIRLRDTELRIASEGGSVLDWRGNARSGDGQVKVTGTTRLGQSGWPTHIEIQGQRFEAVRKPDLHVIASPDLIITLQGQALAVNGKVDIPKAEIRPEKARDTTEVVAEPSPDVVIVGKDVSETEASPWNIALDVQVTLGENVSFEGFGLSAEVDGRLVVTKAADGEITGTGTLVIREGLYKAYGQRLEIRSGSLIFAGGPIANPGIELTAVREVETVTVGINVRGRLKEPILSLFSDPAMEETFILSYLLLGRPPGQASASEAELLVKAASALGLSGGYQLAKKLAQSLGIEETRLDQNTLFLGRSLGDRLYVTYGIGVMEPNNVLQLRYKLSEHWTLKTETGEESMADLLFTIDR